MEKLTSEQRQLVENNMKLAYKYILSFEKQFPYIPKEDIYDICIFALMYTAKNLDPSKGKFSTLFVVNAKSGVFKRIRYYKRGKRNGHVVSLDFEVKFGEGDSKSQTLEDFIGIEDKYDFEIKDMIRESLITLDAREKDVLNRLINLGQTQSEIGKLYNLSQVQVSRVYRGALNKLKEHLTSKRFDLSMI
ncbi:sigma-70 family RNA polymerase sigma factor [Bacillus sp. JJ722]|uniref:sigma-70 family RNA polymerase sigma factor n=1 Tax=Bacillus sp. JJ722 TaxID=3122973 RepID=UPI002FFEC6FF